MLHYELTCEIQSYVFNPTEHNDFLEYDFSS
jgi:hypothetical protein